MAHIVNAPVYCLYGTCFFVMKLKRCQRSATMAWRWWPRVKAIGPLRMINVARIHEGTKTPSFHPTTTTSNVEIQGSLSKSVRSPASKKGALPLLLKPSAPVLTIFVEAQSSPSMTMLGESEIPPFPAALQQQLGVMRGDAMPERWMCVVRREKINYAVGRIIQVGKVNGKFVLYYRH